MANSISNLLCDKIVCGRHAPEESYTRANHFELLVQYFKFSCAYQDYGCQELLDMQKLQKHEIDCFYRPVECPCCHSWRGNFKGLELHITNNHSNAMLNSPVIDLKTFMNTGPEDFSVSSEKTYFIKENNELFTVQLKYCLKGLQFYIMYNGKEPDNELYSYQIQFYSDDNILTFPRYKMEPFNNAYFGQITEVDFKFLNSALRLKSGELKSKIVIIYEQKQAKLGIDLNELNAILECPICLEQMTTPIIMCQTGHSFCKTCCSTLSNCPLCKSPITITRNFALESMVNKTTLESTVNKMTQTPKQGPHILMRASRSDSFAGPSTLSHLASQNPFQRLQAARLLGNQQRIDRQPQPFKLEPSEPSTSSRMFFAQFDEMCRYDRTSTELCRFRNLELFFKKLLIRCDQTSVDLSRFTNLELFYKKLSSRHKSPVFLFT